MTEWHQHGYQHKECVFWDKLHVCSSSMRKHTSPRTLVLTREAQVVDTQWNTIPEARARRTPFSPSATTSVRWAGFGGTIRMRVHPLSSVVLYGAHAARKAAICGLFVTFSTDPEIIILNKGAGRVATNVATIELVTARAKEQV